MPSQRKFATSPRTSKLLSLLSLQSLQSFGSLFSGLEELLTATRSAAPRAVSGEPVNIGVYGCAVFELHNGQDTLIAITLKLIEARPVLSQALRAEEKALDFAAVFIQDDARVA